MAKRVTIDQLAVMVANGFEQITKDFTSVKSRLNTIDEHIERIDLRLDNLVPNFEVKDLRKRVTKIEKHLGFS